MLGHAGFLPSTLLGSFYQLPVLCVGVLMLRALLFGVYLGSSGCLKLTKSRQTSAALRIGRVLPEEQHRS